MNTTSSCNTEAPQSYVRYSHLLVRAASTFPETFPHRAFLNQPLVQKLLARSAWQYISECRIPKPPKISERVSAWTIGPLSAALASLVGRQFNVEKIQTAFSQEGQA